jgi:hypothetical protein
MTTPSNDGTAGSGEGSCRKPRSRFLGTVDLLVLGVWLAEIAALFLYTTVRTHAGQHPEELFSSWFDAVFLIAVILLTTLAYSRILRRRYEQRFAVLLSYGLVSFSTCTSIIPPLMFFGGGG